ncbi:hypothetical protein EZ428_20235 [Pedobacter frigiditerrae]|uniref:HNH endonuclease n=1 Tax=Pedobacter frigiditerrae TaxID=2530452 RepID=A0A4R0MPY2_9SPHI|nr:hypothetical protein [Pedobacter frigiditerrae]TCC88054.1 hypothetical protein EZ428_20235 [Pedobacter frigiditerrae]
MEGKCKLCLKEKELIKRSHLFPNFMYKGIPDEKNRMYIFSSKDLTRRKTVQTGAIDEYILCADCDNRILGQLERYANNYFYSKSYLTTSEGFEQLTPNPGVNIIACTNLDYSRFKLFLISLLWRASVTTHSMFADFKLPCEQEDQLRQSILNNEPLLETSYPCVMMTCEASDVLTDFVAVDPYKKGMVKFFINEFIYTFYWGENRLDDHTLALAIKPDNTMAIIKVSKLIWVNIRRTIIEAAIEASKSNNSKD